MKYRYGGEKNLLPYQYTSKVLSAQKFNTHDLINMRNEVKSYNCTYVIR